MPKDHLISGGIALVVSILATLTALYVSLPIQVERIKVKQEYIEKSIDSIQSELKDTNAEVNEISKVVYYLQRKDADQQGVNTKQYSKISYSKSLSKVETINTLQGVIEKPSFEAKQQFLQQKGYTPKEISSILATPKNKPAKLRN